MSKSVTVSSIANGFLVNFSEYSGEGFVVSDNYRQLYAKTADEAGIMITEFFAESFVI